jgi:non-ribosomal peptide synthase protein (TIGR01720 family)
LMSPQRSASFRLWAQKLSEWADTEEALSEANYWLDEARTSAMPLPVDFVKGLNVERSAGALIITLSEKDTSALLREASKAFRVLPNEALLTALALAGTRWSGQDKFLVDVEGHGREDLFPGLDLSRTVGWFTAIYPVLIDLSEAATALEALKLVKEQVRAVPRGGVGYGALKYLSRREEIAARLQAMPPAEISFNYIGPSAAAKQAEGEIRLVKESLGRLVSEHNSRPYRLMVSGQVENRRLAVRWMYSKRLHRKGTIRKLAGFFQEALQDLIAGCEQKAESLYTPSDFPNANLNQTELDEFLSSLA